MSLVEPGPSDRKEKVVHLHIADEEISHPEVFINWCIGAKFIADRVLEDNKQPLCIFIQLVQTREDGTVREERIFVPDALNVPGRMIPLPQPGKWEINAYLVEILHRSGDKYSKYRAMRNNFFSHRYGRYEYPLDAASPEERFWNIAENVREIGDSYNFARLRGIGSIDIEMPAEAFAPPPPKWLDLWVRAYAPKKLIDECDFRRRIGYAFTVQPFQYVVWEALKRFTALFVGIWLLFMSGRPRGWTVVRRAFSPQLVYAFPNAEINDVLDHSMSIYRGAFRYFTPFKLLLAGGLGYLAWINREMFIAAWQWAQNAYASALAFFPAHSATTAGVGYGALTLAFLLTALFVMFRFQAAYAKANAAKIKARRKEAEQKRDSQRLEREKASYARRKAAADAVLSGETKMLAVCGPDGQPVARGKEIMRKSISLRMSAFKRTICRPFT